MKTIQFICVFLILVPTLTLAESEDISDLAYYEETSSTFQEIDTNQDGILQPEELTASFDVFKEKPSDSEITRKWYVDQLVAAGSSEDVAGSCFDFYDSDENGVLNDSDYAALQQSFDLDKDGSVTSDEYIRYYNNLLTNSGS